MAVQTGRRFFNDDDPEVQSEYALQKEVRGRMKGTSKDITPGSGYGAYDAGMTYNHERGESIYDPVDIMHFHGTAPNGVRVHICRRDASLDPLGRTMYSIAYGKSDTVPAKTMTHDEAIADLKAHGIDV